jgi:type II restriction enzyme
MNLYLNSQLTGKYTSKSQRARVLTEQWVNESVFCPNCGHYNVNKYPNNQPVADFYCLSCYEEYELKSKQKSIGVKIVDGAYRTMIERLQSSKNPNFFFLSYNQKSMEVIDFFVIPKHFFVTEIIEKRKPLAETAHRAGWVGCNILLQNIPQSGKIFFVKDKQIKSKENVLVEWRKTLFLRDTKDTVKKGWLLDVMNCIDKLGVKEFSLCDIYRFENELEDKHPNNHHIKDKIRQQLQFLRNKNYLKFTSRGKYQLR